MNKIESTKTTSAIFLAIVLVAGTIATISPSFMTIGPVQAQPYYDDDIMDNNDYNSYGPTDYVMDKDRKSYGTDSYESQYQSSSYKPDYKPKYTSYDKHDRDKSKKDSSKSVLINKLKCINTNLNINGNNTGDINVGNKGSTGGYLGAYSSGSGSGYGGGGYDGFKKDKDFTCIINNNNANTNGNGDQCESCFDEVTLTFPIVVTLPPLGTITIEDFEELCNLIFSPPFSTSAEQLLRLVEEIVPDGTPQAVIDDIVCNCLVPLLGIQGACPPGPPEP